MISLKMAIMVALSLYACQGFCEETVSSRSSLFSKLERSHNRSGGSAFYIAQRSKEAYEKAFGDLDPTTEHELYAAMRALKAVALYSGDKDYARRGLKYFERYREKYPVTPFLVEMVYTMLSDARLLIDANQLLDRYPTDGLQKFVIEPGADTNGDSALRLLAFDEKKKSFRASGFSLPAGTFIVVAANPLCGFSRKAVAAIEADPSMSKMAAHMKWVIPPASRLSPDVMQKWNVSHSWAKLDVIDGAFDWPSLSVWATPTFYVYRDRALVSMHVGWHGDGDLAVLKVLFDSE